MKNTKRLQRNFQNRLAKEKSPYLLQHKNNPVDWYPWGQEAFEKAKDEQKIIFLSVGYATCHWCHVMERESFENESIASLMNDNFVNVKVDREERPDVDKLYMTYVQSTTGHGGWPMSVFLTPDLKPVFGGTYFPPDERHGTPSFPTILQTISERWKNDKNNALRVGDTIIKLFEENLLKKVSYNGSEFVELAELCDEILDNLGDNAHRSFDTRYGGFGSSPKFPRPAQFTGLLQYYYNTKDASIVEMLGFTLENMYQGGIHDHLGGGFHRYSVDAQWHVPHFEKMLYDQGQLVQSYLSLYTLTKKEVYKKAACDILKYVQIHLTSPQGGFYSAEDADSYLNHDSTEKAEGAFYVWEYDEIIQALGAEKSRIFNSVYSVSPKGNVKSDPHKEFVNKNVLIQRKETQKYADMLQLDVTEVEKILEECKKILYEHREGRPRPFLDDKIITSWNGLMISAFAKAYGVLGDERYLEVAENAAQFIRDNLFVDGDLRRSYREGVSAVSAFANDYACLITALLDIFEVTGKLEWFKWAIELQNTMDKYFYDDENGGYFNAREDDILLLRLKEDADMAEPSENSMAVLNLIRLYHYTQKEDYLKKAKQTLYYFEENLKEKTSALPLMAAGLYNACFSPNKIIIACGNKNEEVKELVRSAMNIFDMNRIVMIITDDNKEYFLNLGLDNIQEKDMKINNKPTVYLCDHNTCYAPMTEKEEIEKKYRSITEKTC